MNPTTTDPLPRSAHRATLAGVLVVGVAHIAWLRFCYDDAFVSFRYAQNLVQGHGLVYNVGERVEGYSNFLWTLLMSLVIAAGGEPATWSQVLGAAFALGSLGLVTLVAPRFGASAAVCGLLVATNASWAAWGTGGLETALFGFCVTTGALALALAEGESDPPRWLAASGLAFGLASLTRPDALVLAGAASAYLVFRVHSRALPIMSIVWWLGPVCLCIVPHAAWRLSYYGQWLPHTFAVKQPSFDQFAGGLSYLAGSARDLHVYLLAVPLFVAPFVGRRSGPEGGARRDVRFVAGAPEDSPTARSRAAVQLWLALVVPFGIYLASTGGDFMPLYRFVAPVVPITGLVAAIAWSRVARRAGTQPRDPLRALMWTVVLTHALLHVHGSWRQQSVWSRGEMVSVGWSRQEMNEWLRIGDLLRVAARPSDTLATTGAGAIPYRSRLHTVDLHGLNAPELEHFRRRASERPGHLLMLEGAWLDAHPPQILLGHPLVHPTAATLTIGIDLEPEWRERVMSHYELVGMRLPGEPVRFVGCAIRRDAVDRIIEAARVPPTPSPEGSRPGR